MTLAQIAQTWDPMRRADAETQQLVLNRIQHCDICPYKKQLGPNGTQVGGENKTESVYYCGMCGCPLWSKLKDPEHGCPDNKWSPIMEDSYY
jgi:hypothetical protein